MRGKRDSICSLWSLRHWAVWGVHFLLGSSVGERWVLCFLPTAEALGEVEKASKSALQLQTYDVKDGQCDGY